ncbi:DUF805 domain-containing protein [Sphingopyxis sp. BSN-002]|uniref:DUF805 domain-containing protein n=1 Tax=Sphingopyxis sp. BSN-002 TaxID=2911495 RepID=UPI001EDA503F|nr:DUF805 domain-containing protein [Sphingopyxis sp. BSN-002]UKK85400.1 DUF805 domain-containing protein [Sphingopyxis sp. BSN-002]
MDWMLMPFRRYADFSGRSQRMEYWMFTLFNVIVVAAIFLITMLLGGFSSGDGPGTLFLVLIGIYALGTIVPSIAVTVRRFHDQDKSGWFYLLGFIPYIGGLVVFVFMCIEGTNGSNRFGPDPKGGHADIFG